jgi:hypothetical protein
MKCDRILVLVFGTDAESVNGASHLQHKYTARFSSVSQGLYLQKFITAHESEILNKADELLAEEGQVLRSGARVGVYMLLHGANGDFSAYTANQLGPILARLVGADVRVKKVCVVACSGVKSASDNPEDLPATDAAVSKLCRAFSHHVPPAKKGQLDGVMVAGYHGFISIRPEEGKTLHDHEMRPPLNNPARKSIYPLNANKPKQINAIAGQNAVQQAIIKYIGQKKVFKYSASEDQWRLESLAAFTDRATVREVIKVIQPTVPDLALPRGLAEDVVMPSGLPPAEGEVDALIADLTM